MTFEVQGLTELLRNLQQLRERVARKVLLEALKHAAEPLRDRMSELAPRSPGGGAHVAEAMTISLARGEDAQEAAVAVGPAQGETFYGGLLEFGTAHTSAQPFARPAFDTEIDEMLTILAADLWRELVGSVTTVSAPSTPSAPGGGGLV